MEEDGVRDSGGREIWGGGRNETLWVAARSLG